MIEANWGDATEIVIETSPVELNLRYTLDCGQAFRWEVRPDGAWVGVVEGTVIRLAREGDLVTAHTFPPRDDALQFLTSYLRLDVDLRRLYQDFGAVDPWVADAIDRFSGLRVLLQPVQETLLSYICSTANSVPRIMKAVREVSRLYGEPLATIDGEAYYAFPTADALAEASPEALRERCGLGWRGDNLRRVAMDVASMQGNWLEGLRERPYAEAKAELMTIRGVGAKIADCVSLFALGKDEAVPVDTHIWAVAREIFGASVPTRTLTPATYEAIAGMFVRRYGEFAGWAQEYLYLQRRAGQGRVKTED